MSETKLILTVNGFIEMIDQLKAKDIKGLAQNSYRDYHTDGLNYLCLKRSEEETIKIYYIPEVRNNNSGYLVHPHNHRYDFDSIVLSGGLKHLRFKEVGDQWTNTIKWKYDYQTGQAKKDSTGCLVSYETKIHPRGQTYHTKSNEIHTLIIYEPTIIGLIQYEDNNDEQFVFLPQHMDNFPSATPKRMDATCYIHLLDQVYRTLQGNKI